MPRLNYQFILRILRKPPKFILMRVHREFLTLTGRFFLPCPAKHFDGHILQKRFAATDGDKLWDRLSQNPYPAFKEFCDGMLYEKVCPGDQARILADAEKALGHQVNLLGSGLLNLGSEIEWHKDYKSGFVWRNVYFQDIDYHNPNQTREVKFPWELSRMQWVIPVGQAYLLTGDEKYALFVRHILESWMDANPYAYSVNWACTMEAAMRIFTWTWFFHVFKLSVAWSDRQFRMRFLNMLYWHAKFTERYLENSDINGNHYTADAAALVFAGLFFQKGKDAARWKNLGWRILNEELQNQIYADGADFEASISYQRLVLELFLFPALYRKAYGLDITEVYRERLVSMARFTLYYSRNNGSSPLWGDADDARVLPFGPQKINEHRYLTGLVGIAFNTPDLLQGFSGSKSEPFWVYGPDSIKDLPVSYVSGENLCSKAFTESGFFIMRNQQDHIFIDCGPVGFGGRGGHGHNDCLSFEAVLAGEHLITDCGAYVYTASYQERNLFRSTAFHNTIQVDEQEINRFDPDSLWLLHNDAIPEVRLWKPGEKLDYFQGTHHGYLRLENPVKPVRTIILDHSRHILLIQDCFEGYGTHSIAISLHLHPGVSAQISDSSTLLLRSGGRMQREFILIWGTSPDWSLEIESGRVSPSYGIAIPATRLVWRRKGNLDKPLSICLSPAENRFHEQFSWVENIPQTVSHFI